MLKLARVLGGDLVEQLLDQGAAMEQYPTVTSAKAPCSLQTFTDERIPGMRGITRMDISNNGIRGDS